jgi:hypothetical protein
MSELDPGLEDLEDPAARRPGSRRPFLLGMLAGCGVSLVLALGLVAAAAVAITVLMGTGHVPDTAAVPGERLPAPTRDFLVEEGLIEPDEQVLYFYSGGFLSLREDGNLFTDRRVISYFEDEGGDELIVEQASYPEIADVEVEYGEGFLADSEVTIVRTDGGSFLLLVCNEEGHDRRFVERLIETWELAR